MRLAKMHIDGRRFEERTMSEMLDPITRHQIEHAAEELHQE
jgi:hypothetical protein